MSLNQGLINTMDTLSQQYGGIHYNDSGTTMIAHCENPELLVKWRHAIELRVGVLYERARVAYDAIHIDDPIAETSKPEKPEGPIAISLYNQCKKLEKQLEALREENRKLNTELNKNHG